MANARGGDGPAARRISGTYGGRMAKRPAAGHDAENRKPPAIDHRIIVLYGPEAFLRALYTTRLREAMQNEYKQLDVFQFDGATTSAADVLDECRSFGLLASRKLIIVDNADQLVKEDSRPLFERYAEAPTEGATLVLRGQLWRAGKLDELIDKFGTVVKCESLSEDKAIGWAIQRASKEHQATLQPDAAALLVERVGTDMARIDAEVAKLASASAGSSGATITRELVGQFVGQSREEDVWAMQGALLSGSASANLAALRQALDVSRQPPVLVMYSMIELARKLHAVAASSGRGGNPWQLKGTLKLFGDTGDRILEVGRRINVREAASVLRNVIAADARTKSGLSDPELAAERTAISLGRLLNPRST